MEAYSNRLSRMVKQTLEDRIADQSANLANTPCEDFPAYKQRVGNIRGLQEALNVIREAEQELDRPEGLKETVAPSGRRYED